MSEWGEPRRWNESDLPEDLRRVLESAEADDDPCRAEELESRLAPLLGWSLGAAVETTAGGAAAGAGGTAAEGAALATGGAVGGGSAGATTAAASGSVTAAGSAGAVTGAVAGAGMASSLKVLVATVVTAGAVAAGAWVATDTSDPAPVPSRPSATAGVEEPGHEPSARAPASSPASVEPHPPEPESVEPDAPSLEPSAELPASGARPVRRSPPPSAAVVPVSPEPGSNAAALADEVAGIESIRQALQTSPHRALELADRHAERFGDGVLGPERDLLRVEALLATGRTAEARSVADSMLRRHPRSAHARRLRRLLPRDAEEATDLHNPVGEHPMGE